MSRRGRWLLREARRDGMPVSNVIRSSVQIYRSYLAEHPQEFLFVASERSGGSPVIRAAVRREVDHFTSEMAQDLRDARIAPVDRRPREAERAARCASADQPRFS